MPTYIIGGAHVLSGAQPADLWRNVIDEETGEVTVSDDADALTPAELVPLVYPGLEGPVGQVAEQVMGCGDDRGSGLLRASSGKRARGGTRQRRVGHVGIPSMKLGKCKPDQAGGI